MNEANTTLTVLDSLAMQARLYTDTAAMNLLQLGRVLMEAKPLVPHGQWAEWVKENSGISVRLAQQYMQAYKKFGLDQGISALGPSHILKLLPLGDEEREQLMAENDVRHMTTRELDEAIRGQKEKLRAEVMAEAQSAILQAEKARDEAERRSAELAEREPEIPAELLDELNTRKREAEQSREEMERLNQYARDSMEEAARLREKNAQLLRENEEQEEILREQQEAMKQTQDELLRMKSANARGDAARSEDDDLTIDVLNHAVREFIGLVARMPYMQSTFATMAQSKKQQYMELVETVEGWAAGARKAMNSYCMEGGISIE